MYAVGTVCEISKASAGYPWCCMSVIHNSANHCIVALVVPQHTGVGGNNTRKFDLVAAAKIEWWFIGLQVLVWLEENRKTPVVITNRVTTTVVSPLLTASGGR